MNNYMNYQKDYNNLANMLPNHNMNKQYSNFNQNSLYEPYEGYIRGNMFPNLYDPYKTDQPFQIQPMNEQAKMLTNLDSLEFAMLDLNLYLDINPDDQNLINLYNQYRVQQENLQKIYESKYGPLLLSSDSLTAVPWAWDNKPWPWEN